jgi:hypothetical protein
MEAGFGYRTLGRCAGPDVFGRAFLDCLEVLRQKLEFRFQWYSLPVRLLLSPRSRRYMTFAVIATFVLRLSSLSPKEIGTISSAAKESVVLTGLRKVF